MIQLTRIELENFCPFYGKQEIPLNFSTKRLIIFEGDTGEGKTSLADAINWCLFGTYPNNENDIKKADFALFNDDILVNSKIKEVLTCRVNLTFEMEDKDKNKNKILFSRNMQLQRKKPLTKTPSGSILPILNDFEFLEISGGNYQRFTALRWIGTRQLSDDSSPDSIRETYFPSIVNDYYMIYGEKFVDPRNSDKIKLAIERNCFAEKFDKTIENLKNVQIEIIRDNTSDNKKREKLEALISKKDEKLSSIKKKKEELEQDKINLANVTEAISKLDTNIGRSGGDQAKLLKDQRIKLEGQIKQKAQNIKDTEKQLRGEGFKVLIRLISRSYEQGLIEELQNRIKKGEIPPNIKTEFINALIEEGFCVCKRKISKNEKKILESLRDENEIGENYNDFLNLKYKLTNDKEILPSKVEDYLTELGKVEKIKVELLNDEENIKRISEELDTLKDVDYLEKERRKFKDHKDKVELDIDLLRKGIDDLKYELGDIERGIRKIGDIKSKKDSDTDKFIDLLVDIIEKTKNNIIESTRKDIESYASKIYKELFKYASEVERVELDKDYQVRVILNKGNNEVVKTKFSTGEGLVFAISFLTALRRYSGYNGPIFLDSPFSVLDKNHRVKVSLNLPITIPGQLVIFTRPDTFEDIKPTIMPYVSKLVTLIKEKEWHSTVKIN
jgi:DNA sulfur modification protein DndD